MKQQTKEQATISVQQEIDFKGGAAYLLKCALSLYNDYMQLVQIVQEGRFDKAKEEATYALANNSNNTFFLTELADIFVLISEGSRNAQRG